jgi:hypothetical protein
VIQPTCNLRQDINNKLFVIIAKCELLEMRFSSLSVFEATEEIKEIAFRVSEMMDTQRCRAVNVEQHRIQRKGSSGANASSQVKGEGVEFSRA